MTEIVFAHFHYLHYLKYFLAVSIAFSFIIT